MGAVPRGGQGALGGPGGTFFRFRTWLTDIYRKLRGADGSTIAAPSARSSASPTRSASAVRYDGVGGEEASAPDTGRSIASASVDRAPHLTQLQVTSPMKTAACVVWRDPATAARRSTPADPFGLPALFLGALGALGRTRRREGRSASVRPFANARAAS